MPAHNNQPDTPAQVTLLFGESEVLKDRAARRIIVARLQPDERDSGLIILEAADVELKEWGAQLASRSLLASEQVMLIKRVDALDAERQEVLAGALVQLPATTTVIMTAGPGKGKTQQAPVVKELRKAIAERGQIQQLSSPVKQRLHRWVVQEAEQLGKAISTLAVESLLELTEGQVDRLANELEKLAVYVGERPQIEAEDVQTVGSASQQGNVWRLVDGIGDRRADQALEVLSVLLPAGARDGAALPLLGNISRQLRLIWQARVAARAGYRLDRATELPEELVARFPTEHNVLTAVRRADFLRRKLTNQARNFTDVQLARALARIHETDLILKGQGGEQIDELLAMEMLIVELCQL